MIRYLTKMRRERRSHDDQIQLNSATVEKFERDGFVQVIEACTQEEAQEIRLTLADMFARRVGFKEGAQFDVLRPDSGEAMTLGQITNPSYYEAKLRKTAYVKWARKIAKQFLGPKAHRSFDMVLMKPARTGSETPWHQDEAYRDARYDSREMTFWLPLQDVDATSGCLQFVPGTHLSPVKPHRSPNNDLTFHSLECCEIPSPEEIVSVPLKVGECSIHDGRVLHGSPPNRSDVPRFAYIIVFQTPAVPARDPKTYSWLAEKQNINKKRRDKWIRRGGFIVLGWRKFLSGELTSLRSFQVSLQRCLRLLSGRF